MEPIQSRDFALWLQQRIAVCKEKQAELTADDRKDEAVFERIRANVYEIFHTVLTVACKTSGGDTAKARSFFASKLVSLPQNWKTALAAAQKHGDIKRITEECIKLDVLAEIEAQFTLLWKE